MSFLHLNIYADVHSCSPYTSQIKTAKFARVLCVCLCVFWSGLLTKGKHQLRPILFIYFAIEKIVYMRMLRTQKWELLCTFMKCKSRMNYDRWGLCGRDWRLTTSNIQLVKLNKQLCCKWLILVQCCVLCVWKKMKKKRIFVGQERQIEDKKICCHGWRTRQTFKLNN